MTHRYFILTLNVFFRVEDERLKEVVKLVEEALAKKQLLLNDVTTVSSKVSQCLRFDFRKESRRVIKNKKAKSF